MTEWAELQTCILQPCSFRSYRSFVLFSPFGIRGKYGLPRAKLTGVREVYGFQHANVIDMDRRGLYRYITSRQRYTMMQLRNDSDVVRFGKIYVPVSAL
jgi:hypothetical protein